MNRRFGCITLLVSLVVCMPSAVSAADQPPVSTTGVVHAAGVDCKPPAPKPTAECVFHRKNPNGLDALVRKLRFGETALIDDPQNKKVLGGIALETNNWEKVEFRFGYYSSSAMIVDPAQKMKAQARGNSFKDALASMGVSSDKIAIIVPDVAEKQSNLPPTPGGQSGSKSK
jgi:hypothetical protein